MMEADQKAMNEEELFSTFVSELYDFHQGSRVNVAPTRSLFRRGSTGLTNGWTRTKEYAMDERRRTLHGRRNTD